MTSHDLRSEHGTVTPDGRYVLLGWCRCDLLYVATARTLQAARRKVVRKSEDHRGHVRAAGPGWAEAA
jgi:hypothetical protein